jgi:hypothetical protein
MKNNSGKLAPLFAFVILLFALWSNVAAYAQNRTAAVNLHLLHLQNHHHHNNIYQK